MTTLRINAHTDIHALSGIRTHDPRVRAREDCLCFRSGGHCDQPITDYLSIYLWLYSPLLDLGRFFSFLTLYRVGRTPWTGEQPVARPLPTRKTTRIENKHTQTFMPLVGFELTIPAFEREKALYALDRAATVIGRLQIIPRKFLRLSHETDMSVVSSSRATKIIMEFKHIDVPERIRSLNDEKYSRLTCSSSVAFRNRRSIFYLTGYINFQNT
jgi:hypothetical protein